MANDITKGKHYKATITGYYKDNDYIFIDINDKFTAYLDISKHDYDEDDIKNHYKVMSTIDVVVTDIDKFNTIKCVECSPYNLNEQDKEQKRKKKQPKSDHLQYSLGSLLSNIKIDEK